MNNYTTETYQMKRESLNFSTKISKASVVKLNSTLFFLTMEFTSSNNWCRIYFFKLLSFILYLY